MQIVQNKEWGNMLVSWKDSKGNGRQPVTRKCLGLGFCPILLGQLALLSELLSAQTRAWFHRSVWFCVFIAFVFRQARTTLYALWRHCLCLPSTGEEIKAQESESGKLQSTLELRSLELRAQTLDLFPFSYNSLQLQCALEPWGGLVTHNEFLGPTPRIFWFNRSNQSRAWEVAFLASFQVLMLVVVVLGFKNHCTIPTSSGFHNGDCRFLNSDLVFLPIHPKPYKQVKGGWND